MNITIIAGARPNFIKIAPFIEAIPRKDARFIARQFLKLRFISLVNLIMDKEIVRELIQYDLNEQNLTTEINILLPGGWKRDVMLNNYRQLSSLLSGEDTSRKIALDIFQTLMMVNNVN